jgi:hypothetical protein
VTWEIKDLHCLVLITNKFAHLFIIIFNTSMHLDDLSYQVFSYNYIDIRNKDIVYIK